MNRIKGFIGLSIIVFVLSSIFMLVLVVDDQRDLSSRANLSNLSTPSNPLTVFPEESNSKYSLGYNQKIWFESSKDFFLNLNNGTTLRLIENTQKAVDPKLYLGSEFTTPKILEQDTLLLSGWTIQKYSYSFLGDTKLVNIWKNSDLSILEVSSKSTTSEDVINFVKSIQKKDGVLGASTPDDSAKLATLIRPSVSILLNHYCLDLKFFSTPGFSLSDKVYPLCLTSAGTGFFISETGLLATNGHLVKNFPQSTIYYALSSGKLDSLLIDFLEVYMSESSKTIVPREIVQQKVKEAHTKKEVLYQLGGLVVDLNKKNILKIQNEKNSYYLQVGNSPITLKENEVLVDEGVVPADLIASDYSEATENEGFTSSDVAILKAKTGSYPGLPLGSVDDAIVGSNLQVVGFPAAAMGSTTLLLDANSNTEPTFSKGVVSAIKLAKGNQKKLIQTDAIINHGNSGGPAINTDGKVVGIATYGINVEDGNGSYNFLRDIQDIKDLAEKNNLALSPGKVYDAWNNGLKNYWMGYHKYAVEEFEKVKVDFPLNPLLDKYLTSSTQKINTIEDLTPKLTHKQRSTYMFLAGVAMALSLISFVVLSFLNYQNKKKQQANQTVPTF